MSIQSSCVLSSVKTVIQTMVKTKQVYMHVLTAHIIRFYFEIYNYEVFMQ